MLFTYKVDPEQRLIRIRGGGGSFKSQECVDTVKELVRDPAYGPSLGILTDLRDVEYVPTYQETGFFLTFLSGVGLFREQPIAIVVKGPAHFGHVHTMAVMANAKGLNMCAFNDIEDACAWLAELTPDITRAR